jgi:hypothetical protein
LVTPRAQLREAARPSRRAQAGSRLLSEAKHRRRRLGLDAAEHDGTMKNPSKSTFTE